MPFPLQQGHQFTADEAGTPEQKQPHSMEDALGSTVGLAPVAKAIGEGH